MHATEKSRQTRRWRRCPTGDWRIRAACVEIGSVLDGWGTAFPEAAARVAVDALVKADPRDVAELARAWTVLAVRLDRNEAARQAATANHVVLEALAQKN